MRTAFRSGFVAVTVLIAVGTTPTLRATSETVQGELAQARAATALYHDVEQALADGYIDFGTTPSEGEGIEYVNLGLVDCSLDAERPEALRYVESGQRLRLVAVEYAIPMACTSEPPEDFLEGAGDWEPEPGVPVWSMLVPVWSGGSLDFGDW